MLLTISVLSIIVISLLLTSATADSDYVQDPVSESGHVRCVADDDCDRNEVCMSWQYDPTLEYHRKLRSRLSSGVDKPGTHQFCVDAWIIYNNHLSDLDGPRTGGGLRSNRRGFDSEDYYFSARRPARQYNAYGEDMMLVLFLVCILATLVTVHRAACYRQIQDARRNTPLRHIIPIPEDNPPPYTHRYPDSVDGPSSIVHSSSEPKPLTEAPPPTYEEALERQAIVQNDIEETHADHHTSISIDLATDAREDTSENIQGVNHENSLGIYSEGTILIVSDGLETGNGGATNSDDIVMNPGDDGEESQAVQSDSMNEDEVIDIKDIDATPADNCSAKEGAINQCEGEGKAIATNEDDMCTYDVENEIKPSKEGDNNDNLFSK